MNKFLGFFIALIVSVSAFSQQYNFINYSIEEGLAQSQIRAINQDKEGYLWIGTLGGLSKFDGINFENYSINEGLLHNQINAIYSDSIGRIWLGTQGGVSVYDGEKFTNYRFDEKISQHFVLSISEDKNGRMWFATGGGGVVYLEGEELNYINLPNGKRNNYVRNIFIDKNDNKWLATRNGVTVIDAQLNLSDTIQDVNATQVYVDEDNTVWCSTFGDGVLRLDGEKRVKFEEEDGLISNHIRAFVKRKDGTFWFVSKNGISKWAKEEFKNFTEKDGLNNNNIKTIMEDDEGNLFLGSDGGGLIKFNNENFMSYTDEGVIKSNVVMSVLQDHNNNIWVSTYEQGAGVFTSKGFYLYTVKEGLGNNTVWCSMAAKNNNIWVGTDNGISVFNGKKFKTYNEKDGLMAKKVYALAEDDNGKIWVGTRQGVSVFNRESERFESYEIGRNIRDILIENERSIWFCSSDGLIHYNPKSLNKTVYTEEDGLPSSSVMNIIKGENAYWIGTNNGLVKLANDSLSTIKIPDNYASNNINFLELDHQNNLWIGTNYGLYQLNILNKDTFSRTDFIRYSNVDGLKSLECNQNSSFIDNKNNLWFGTSYGLMKRKLDVGVSSVSLPKVQVTDIRLFLEKQNLSKYAKGISSETGLPEGLNLKYNKNHLTFDFVGIYHTSPDKVKYRYRLAGFDENWQPVTRARYVTYSNIPSGDFTFELSATTDLKHWTKPVEFSFSITPPFWATWWFYLLCFITSVGIVWLIVNRSKKIDLRKRETQLIVDKSKMMQLEQQALNSSMNRHFIFNALNSIQYYINRQDRISANKYLSSFAKLVRKNLDSSLVNEIYLDDEIERINLYLKLEEMRFKDKFDYSVKVDKNIEPQSVKIPSMLLQPFIENSIWHGILPRDQKGNISVTVDKKGDKLIIVIKDDGIGIDQSIEDKIGKNQHHDSKGMELTKGRIKLISKTSNKDCAIKGPYQIYNEKREVAGTEVSIILTL
ncbi:MAG: ligand-binding sensor domain-containing protein [Vicingaceae bacterium]